MGGASIDPHVAKVLDQSQQDSDDEDALIAQLEDDEGDHALAALREQRINQLHAEFSRAQVMRESGQGTYQEIKDEKQLMDLTTSTKLCVVHFWKSDFGRCDLMHRHLETLAPKHFDTRFLSISVDSAPFLVTKLNVRVLPCVLAFVNGVTVDRITGFEGLPGGDKFTTKDLERRLLQANVLVREKVNQGNILSSSVHAENTMDEFNDDDWD